MYITVYCVIRSLYVLFVVLQLPKVSGLGALISADGVCHSLHFLFLGGSWFLCALILNHMAVFKYIISILHDSVCDI